MRRRSPGATSVNKSTGLPDLQIAARLLWEEATDPARIKSGYIEFSRPLLDRLIAAKVIGSVEAASYRTENFQRAFETRAENFRTEISEEPA